MAGTAHLTVTLYTGLNSDEIVEALGYQPGDAVVQLPGGEPMQIRADELAKLQQVSVIIPDGHNQPVIPPLHL